MGRLGSDMPARLRLMASATTLMPWRGMGPGRRGYPAPQGRRKRRAASQPQHRQRPADRQTGPSNGGEEGTWFCPTTRLCSSASRPSSFWRSDSIILVTGMPGAGGWGAECKKCTTAKNVSESKNLTQKQKHKTQKQTPKRPLGIFSSRPKKVAQGLIRGGGVNTAANFHKCLTVELLMIRPFCRPQKKARGCIRGSQGQTSPLADNLGHVLRGHSLVQHGVLLVLLLERGQVLLQPVQGPVPAQASDISETAARKFSTAQNASQKKQMCFGSLAHRP